MIPAVARPSSSAPCSSGRRRHRMSIVIGGGIVGVFGGRPSRGARAAGSCCSSDGESRRAPRVGTPVSSSTRSTPSWSNSISRPSRCTGRSTGSHAPAAPAGLLSVTHDVDGVRRLATASWRGAPAPATDLRRRPTTCAASNRRSPRAWRHVAWTSATRSAPAAATRAYAARAERAGVEIRIGDGGPAWREDGRALGVDLVDGDERARGRRRGRGRRAVDARRDRSDRRVAADRPSLGRRRAGDARGAAPHVLEEAEISIEPGAEDDGEAGHAFSLVTAEGSSSLGSTFLADEPEPRRSCRRSSGAVRGSSRRSPMRASGLRACARGPRASTGGR